MKKTLTMLGAILGLPLLLVLVSPAHASDHGCRVMLCLSNPNGPMAERECIPDIQRLKIDLALKRPFPTCEEAAPSTMQPDMRAYDRCRDGTTPLSSGTKAISMSEADYAVLMRSATQSGITIDRVSFAIQANVPVVELPQGIRVERGIGEGSPNSGPEGPNKICVANALGSVAIATGVASSHSESESNPLPEYEMIEVYRNMSTIGPAAGPFVVDVYIDGKLYRSVRP